MLKKSLSIALIALAVSGPRLFAQGAGIVGPPDTVAAQQASIPKAQPVTAAPATSAGAQGGVATALRDGDVVDIRIANVPPEDVGQIDGSYTIDESGMLNLPFIGMLKAGGLPPSRVQTDIQNKYISDGIYTNPTVLVNPPVGARFISVGGAVRAPGRVPYTSDLTIMSTINAAGGASDFAGDLIRLTRSGKILKFSRKKLYKDPTKDIPIEPGDQIEVVESWW
jgi:polysaccharide export outer membrane protein